MNEDDANILETLTRLDSERMLTAERCIDIALDMAGLVALPNDMTLHDLEKHLPHRRRLRGRFMTNRLGDFAMYVSSRADDLTPNIFISPNELHAVAVFNIGDIENPGHGDDRARLTLEPTAEAKALDLAHGNVFTQAEFLDWAADWSYALEFVKAGKIIPQAAAIAALRDVTITRSKASQFSEHETRREVGSLEAVEVRALETMPDGVQFMFRPADDLPVMTALCRLVFLPNEDDNPKKAYIRLRVVGAESLRAENLRRFADLLRESMPGARVLVGSYES